MPHDKVNEDTAKCPMSLDEVDLFEPGAQNFWYDSYKILHKESPVHRIPGEGTSIDTDGFILMKYEDIAFVVKDILRFPPPVMQNTDLEKSGVSGFNAEKDDMDEENETSIRAPFKGVITSRYAVPGAFVTPTTSASSSREGGSTSSSIVKLSQGLEIVAKVPESGERSISSRTD